MNFVPVGWITTHDAVAAVAAAFDENTDAAQELLLGPLFAKKVRAVVWTEEGKMEDIPRPEETWGADYGKFGLVVLRHGSFSCILPRPLAGKVFIDRAELEAWIAASRRSGPRGVTTGEVGAPPAAKGPMRSDLKAQYQQHFRHTTEKNGRPPTVAEDDQWRRALNVPRDRLRELRQAHLPAESRKGGRPRNLAVKPGGK